MANYRQIHVSIWKDEWFLDLDPEEKLLFIYLFSNESTNLAGIYKIAFKVICFETGLDKDFVEAALLKFANSHKVYYDGSIVWVVNLRRYHASASPKVLSRIQADLDNIPDCPLKIQYQYHIDTLSLKEEEENKEDEKDDTVPAFRLLYDAFIEYSSLNPLMLNEKRAVDEITKKWIPSGVTKRAIELTIQEYRQQGLSIAGPWSITNGLNITMSRMKASQEANSGYNYAGS